MADQNKGQLTAQLKEAQSTNKKCEQHVFRAVQNGALARNRDALFSAFTVASWG